MCSTQYCLLYIYVHTVFSNYVCRSRNVSAMIPSKMRLLSCSGSLNCAAFTAGMLEAVLNGANFVS